MEPLLGSLNGSSSRKAARLGACGAVFTLIALVLYVITLSTPQMIHRQGVGAIDSSALRSDFGPFRVCWTLDLIIREHGCGNINGHCAYTTKKNDNDKDDDQVVDNCDKLNAARGFQVIATICTVVALLAQLYVVCKKGGSKSSRSASAGFALLAGLTGLISMALWADMKNNDAAFTDAGSSSFQYGFWLLIGAWVLNLLSSFPFCAK